MLGADLVFEVELFLAQLFLQLRDLPVRQTVLHGDGNLLRDLAEQLDIVRREGTVSQPAHVQGAEHAIAGEERDTAERLHAVLRAGAARSSIQRTGPSDPARQTPQASAS